MVTSNRILMAIAIACTVLSSVTAHGQSKKIDWTAVNKETFENFTSLIKIDSSNPPGNETEVTKKIQAILQKEGIESQLVGSEPNRLSLIARIKGNGSKKPILVLGHTDVVGVQKEKWT